MTKDENIPVSILVQVFNWLNDIFVHVDASPFDISDGVLKSMDQDQLLIKIIWYIIHAQNKFNHLQANLILHFLETSAAFCQAIQNTRSFDHQHVHSAIVKLSHKRTKLWWVSNEENITVVVDEMEGFSRLVLQVLLAIIVGIPDNSCWTHPALLISETD